MRTFAVVISSQASFHTPEYVNKVKTLSAASGGEVGDETSIAKGGYEIAALAAGGAIAAVRKSDTCDEFNCFEKKMTLFL